MPVKTGCSSKSGFHKKNIRPADSGTVILITRGRPYPWVDYDEYQPILSPHLDTKNKWFASKKTEADWKRYEEEFFPQMKEIKAVEAIEALRQRVKKKGETITLLCYCKEGEHCHRDIIKSMIEEH